MKALRDWRPSDPGHFALRLAVRTGIVVPVALALGVATGNDQTALFAAFGSISMLLFVDFGGPRPVRLIAYLSLMVVGCVLIILGTLCSRHPAIAAIAMAIIGFLVLFSGILNGYFAAAASATLLTFILPTMVAAEAGEIPARLAGFGIAAALAIPAALFLFPARPRDRLRDGIANACRALAELERAPSPEAEQAGRTAMDELHRRFASTPFRPTGPTGATGALAAMVDELDWLMGLILTPVPVQSALPPTASELALRAASVHALLASASLVEGRAHALPDRDALERGREMVFDELLQQLADDHIRDDDDRLWAAIVRVWEVRIISFVALDIAAQAALAGGYVPGGDGRRWIGFFRRQGIALAASGHLAAAHAGARSVWFRNSVRGAIGLALAVLLAQEASVQHAFWVVLGCLSVLRSSALNTGATILQALLGTFIGIVLGGLLLTVIGGNDTLTWVVLPLAAMIAAYAPRAISFAAGQAGFTVAVFLIFDIIHPTGWQVGLIRLEDVSIGFLISLVVGLLFWPRGARALLRRSLGDAIAASGRYVAGGYDRLISAAPGGAVSELQQHALAAEGRLDVAFRQVLAERPSDDVRMGSHTRLVTTAVRLQRTSDAMQYLADRLGDAPRPQRSRRLLENAGGLSGWYVALGDSIAHRAAPPPPHDADRDTHAELLVGLREALGSGEPRAGFAALATAWGALHLDQLGRLEQRAAQAAAELLPEPLFERETPGA